MISLNQFPSTQLIIPCFNEAKRLNRTQIYDALTRFPDLNLCFVNDGSTDETASVLNELQESWNQRITFLDLKTNQGKAEAIRQGFLHCLQTTRLGFIGYWDADFAVPLDEIPYFHWFATSSSESPDILIGARIQRLGSSIKRRPLRHYLGRVFATAASLVLKIPVYDTQCGAKLIRSSCAMNLFEKPFKSRWIFDVEILARYQRASASPKLLEVPLKQWTDIAGSKVRTIHFLRAPWELLQIWWST